MQYAHPYYPQRVKDEWPHGPAHAGRTGRQPTTPEAWTRTSQRQARENSPLKNPFDLMVCDTFHWDSPRSPWRQRRADWLFFSPGSHTRFPNSIKDWLRMRVRRPESPTAFVAISVSMQEPFMTCALVHCTATVSLKSVTRRNYALQINGVSTGIKSFITYRQQGHDDLQSAGKKKMRSNARS